MSAIANMFEPSGFAEAYDRLAGMEGDFTPLQVDVMALSRDHSVLDIGAGSGRLTLPIARRVSRVTALDSSPALLTRLEDAARGQDLSNITTMAARWEDVEPGRDLPRHDVVVASRFTGEQDLMKLDAAANELVYLILFAGPSTRALHSALLDGIVPTQIEIAVATSGVVALFNEIASLGLEPNVVHVPDGFSRLYADEASALADFGWLDVQPGLEAVRNRNIRRFLRPDPDGVRFLFETRSAVVWWRK